MKKLALALAATAGLSLGAAAVTPAMANYAFCTENPTAKGCPGDFNLKDEPIAQPRPAPMHHAARLAPSKSAAVRHEPSKVKVGSAKHEPAKKSASAKNETPRPIRSASHQTHQPAKQHG